MTFYINPRNGVSKEAFLQENGTEVLEDRAIISTTHLPVALVRNTGFSAAAIADNEAELRRLVQGSMNRDVRWFMVSRDALKDFLT